MGFLSFWPLALLILVPVIILLYILKQEARPHVFSSTLLWQETFKNIEATKPWEKLKKNLLLFLQILTVLLFILALMGPWIRSKHSQGQAILVIDNSASMNSIYDGDVTRLEQAKASAISYIDSLPGDTVIHVIAANKDAALVLSNSKDKIEAKNRVNGIEETFLPGDLSTSLGLVESCRSQSEDSDIVFFTDTSFDIGDLNASVESLYSKNANMGLGKGGGSWKEDMYTILFPLTNFSSNSSDCEINLYGINESGGEKLIEVKDAECQKGQTVSVYFEYTKEQIKDYKAIKAEINEKDALLGDNVSYIVPEQIRQNKVLLYTKSNIFVEKALENLPGIEVSRTSDESVFADNLDYDLYIFDGAVPETLPENGNYMFINCQWEPYFTSEDKIKGKVLKLADTEVTPYIGESEVGVNESKVYRAPAWGTSFISAGSDSAGFYGIYDGHKMAVIGFDLHQTDFCLQVEFPILMSSLSEYLLESSLVERTEFTCGESVVMHGSSKGESLLLAMPDGKNIEFSSAEAGGAYTQVSVPGVYQVSQKVDGGFKEQSFAANFPTDLESEVDSVQSMFSEGGGAKAADIRSGVLEIRNYILILLLLVMIFEWIVYVRMQ